MICIDSSTCILNQPLWIHRLVKIWGKGAIVQDLFVNKIHIPGDWILRVYGHVFFTPKSYSYSMELDGMSGEVLKWLLKAQVLRIRSFLSCHLTRHLASLAHWHPSHLHRPECSWSVGADKIVRVIVSAYHFRSHALGIGILVLWSMNP